MAAERLLFRGAKATRCLPGDALFAATNFGRHQSHRAVAMPAASLSPWSWSIRAFITRPCFVRPDGEVIWFPAAFDEPGSAIRTRSG
jgi:hypothetical protein